RLGAARTADHDAVVLRVNLDLVAREARQFGRQHEVGRRLVQIDRRRPAGCIGADEMTELFVEGEQIAQRIPARESHVFILARLSEAMTYVLRLQGYTDTEYAVIPASDASPQGQPHQGRERSVPDPRAPSPHAGQQARAHPGSDAQHSHRLARRSEVP